MTFLKRPQEHRQLKDQTTYIVQGFLRCYTPRHIKKTREAMGKEVAQLPPRLVFHDLTILLNSLQPQPGMPTQAYIPEITLRNFWNRKTEKTPTPAPLNTMQTKSARQLTIEMPKHA